ncbi:Cold shock-like protein CspD [Legionella busanensis]|uniref:Cold shock-like protein CspD n=1 Tax=Legionella busanensis TaxID=190655 RepID=A0A378JNS2_9GAMM|nr:cold-shock protein [Legionella busanensis]STX52328.1 Cold shock-like protein CspD [Legionella busanensis]
MQTETGTVVRFNKIKGYGFISSDRDNREIFIHFSEVQTQGYKELKPGQRVSFLLARGEKGEFARQVQVID